VQKQKAGKRKIYVFAVGMILLFLIGKYSGWSGRLLNGDLTQALQHITAVTTRYMKICLLPFSYIWWLPQWEV